MFAPPVEKSATKATVASARKPAHAPPTERLAERSASRNPQRNVAWNVSEISPFPPDRARQPDELSSFPVASLSGRMQAKLTVGEASDPLEKEADRVADQVMHTAASDVSAVAPPHLSRKCAACEEEENTLRTKPTTTARRDTRAAPNVVHDVLRAPGRPLDTSVRAFFEPRFGYNFSQVRVHTDEEASLSARSVDALAYTFGNHVVFDTGRYAPKSGEGQRLLAHELAHVVQQGFAPARPEPPKTLMRQPAPSMLQRAANGQCSGLGTTCAPPDQCTAPDKAGGSGSSTMWSLTINIDVERSSWEEALRNQEFGHTNVRLSENSGQEYSYGFYPAGNLPNERQPEVSGCVHHPDTTHDACVDDRVTYSLTAEQYGAALAYAQQICRDGHTYGPAFTCTTFAAGVAKAAGQTLPSSSSKPTTVFYQAVPSIDNPNTLEENVESERAKLPLGRGEYWNAPATPAARAQVMDENVRDIVNDVNSQTHRMAFLLLNALNMREMLDTLDRVAAQIDLQTGLIDMLPVAQGVDKKRLTVALRAVQLKRSGLVSPEQAAALLALDPSLPDDQKAVVSTYLGQASK